MKVCLRLVRLRLLPVWRTNGGTRMNGCGRINRDSHFQFIMFHTLVWVKIQKEASVDHCTIDSCIAYRCLLSVTMSVVSPQAWRVRAFRLLARARSTNNESTLLVALQEENIPCLPQGGVPSDLDEAAEAMGEAALCEQRTTVVMVS